MWLSSDALDREKWIPSSLLRYGGNTDDNIVLRLKGYYQILFRDTFLSGHFHPERHPGSGVVLISDKDNQTVDSLFGLGAPPTNTVEISEEVYYYLLHKAGYQWLFYDKKNNEIKYFAFFGPATLAISIAATKNCKLLFKADNHLYRNYIYYNIDRVTHEARYKVFKGVGHFNDSNPFEDRCEFSLSPPQVTIYSGAPLEIPRGSLYSKTTFSPDIAVDPTDIVQSYRIDAMNGSIIQINNIKIILQYYYYFCHSYYIYLFIIIK
jgi:hypothetical protein